MTRATLLLTSPLVLLGFGAHADQMPARKPGLWEITSNQSGSPPDVSRLCIDETTEAELIATANATMKEICSRHDTRRKGDVITEDSVCKPMKSRTTTHAVTTFHGDGAYSRASTSNYDPPFLGKTEANVTQEGKWLGPCGPDMKPGDFLTHGQSRTSGPNDNRPRVV